MQFMDSDLALMEQTFMQATSDSNVIIVKDRSSTLYLTDDSSFDHPVFLEVSESKGANDPKAAALLPKQMRLLAKLSHPNIAPILDSGTNESGNFYAVIDHFTAVSLSQRLVELRRGSSHRSAVEMLELISQLAAALSMCHQVGIIHQDLRPEKILLNEHGQPLLTGFTVVQSPNQTRNTIGDLTPVDELDYESPEQAAGETVTKASNIYSLGIILYELLAGRRPSVPIGQWQVDDLPQSRHELPLEQMRGDLAKETYALVSRCLRDAPFERYQSMSDLQAAIHTALMAEQTSVDRAVLVQSGQAPTNRRFPAWIIAILVLLVLIGVGAASAFYFRGSTPTSEAMEPAEGAAVAIVAATAVPTEAPDLEATAAVVAAATQKAEEAAMMAATEQAMVEAATATPEPEPTVLPTAVVIEAEICQPTAAIVLVYPHTARGYNLTLTDINFPLNWEIQNGGNCPVPSSTKLVYVAGETFGANDQEVTLADELAVGETTTISTTLVSPETAGTYSSTWQLVDEADNPVSEPYTFELRTFVSESDVAAAAAEVPQPLDWSYTIDGSSCEYVGADWVCDVAIIPTGGGGQYTLQLFDQPNGQASLQSGSGPFSYQARAKRCEPFKRDLSISEGSAGVALQATLFLVPNDFFNCEKAG